MEARTIILSIEQADNMVSIMLNVISLKAAFKRMLLTNM